MADRPSPPTARGMGGGIGVIAVALLISGVLVNAYLAVVARNLSPDQYLHFSAFWSLALVVGFGVFLPIEQEMIRLLRRAGAASVVLRAGGQAAFALGALEIFVLLMATPLLMGALGHDLGLLVTLAALCVVSAAQFVVRGALIGLGRMRLYALVLLVDSGLRVFLAASLGALVRAGSTDYAVTLVLAVGLAHVPVLIVLLRRPTRPVLGPADPLPARALARTIGPLLVGSLAAQIMLNGIPVLIAATAGHGHETAAGQFQAAFQLVRVPLFLAVPLQTAILPTLTVLFGSASHEDMVRTVARFALGVIGLALLGMLVGYAIGPELTRLVFGARYGFSRTGLALLALGVACYLGLILLTQALVASSRHAQVARSWLVALAFGAVVYATVPDFLLAAELAFTVGSAAGLIAGFTQLPAWRRHHPATDEGV